MISKNSFKSDKVSRIECITAVMKIVGITPDLAQRATQAIIDPSIFDDVRGEENDGYVMAAGMFDIAFGEGKATFNSTRTVTVKETIAFIFISMMMEATAILQSL